MCSKRLRRGEERRLASRAARRWPLAAALATAAVFGLGTGPLAVPDALAQGRCGDPAQRPWCNAALSPDQRATLLLNALTSDERISLLAGDDLYGGFTSSPTIHAGTSDGVDRVGLATMYYSDGPVGPRQGPATAMPVPMALAATWDPALASAHGAEVANEAKFKGNDAVFAPTVNIMRTPLGGRTFEAYGEDPFLNSRMTVSWVEGAQSQGVLATVKHFAANNMEGQDPTGQEGKPGALVGRGVVSSRYVENSILDDRTLHEVYLPQFEAAVKEAHVAIVMCAYNELNGTYSCENGHLLKDILERDWGFQGYVLADYGAAHNTIANLNGGLDFEPWPGWSYSPNQVKAALDSGQVTMGTVDDHVRRILRTLFAFGFFDRPAYRNDDSQIDQGGHAQTAQQIEESAITLLRNDGILPLDAAHLGSIAVIGNGANSFVTGGGSGSVTPFSFVSPLQAITQRAGPGVKVTYDDGSNATQAAADARAADVAIVFANDYETEGTDRNCLTLECPDQGNQDGLIQSVAAAQHNTIVVLETGGPVLTPWRDQIRALVEAWYPGERGGPAIARTLFGDVDPGGRLPVTFPAAESDTPTAGDPEKYPGVANRVTYKEGVFVGYRWFDAHGLTPAYPFGFGLSYTTFTFGGLQVAAATGGGDAMATVSANVTNTGSRAGVAVPEVYLGLPSPRADVPQPPRELKGFTKLQLAPGQRRRVSIALDRRAFSYWDTTTSSWQIAPGCYRLIVGSSSRDLPLTATVALGGVDCGPGAIRLVAAAPGGAGHACASRRTILVHLRGLGRAPARRVTIFINGVRQKALPGPRRTARIRLTGRPRGRYRIKMVIRTASGRRVVDRRVYHTCRPHRGRRSRRRRR